MYEVVALNKYFFTCRIIANVERGKNEVKTRHNKTTERSHHKVDLHRTIEPGICTESQLGSRFELEGRKLGHGWGIKSPSFLGIFCCEFNHIHQLYFSRLGST